MRLVQMAVVALAIVTMGLAMGGATASLVVPVPVPVSSLGPGGMIVAYTVNPGLGGGPAMFTPYLTSIAHPGWVHVYLANGDVSPHAYLLTGSPLLLTAPTHGITSTYVYLSHPGQYTWVNFLATPGVPFGMTVGILIVR